MVTINLEPGNHTIEMSLAGYTTFRGVITVSSTGAIYCVSVEGGSCGSQSQPGMTVFNNVVTAIMKASAGGMCEWISRKGEGSALTAYDIMSLVKSYAGQENIGFNVTSAYIMGAIAYYSGNKSSGNQLTGCVF